MVGEFSYTMSDGTVIDIEVGYDPDNDFSYFKDDDLPMSWDRINEMSRNLLLYGTIDRPDWIVSM